MQMMNKNLIDAYNSAKTHNEKIFQLDCLQHKERIIESIKSALSKFKSTDVFNERGLYVELDIPNVMFDLTLEMVKDELTNNGIPYNVQLANNESYSMVTPKSYIIIELK